MPTYIRPPDPRVKHKVTIIFHPRWPVDIHPHRPIMYRDTSELSDLPLTLSQLLEGDPPKADWLIADMLNKGQMIVTAGEAGAGKSFFWYSAAMCVATGKPFMGRECAQGPVLYFDDENSLPELHKYLYQIWIGLGKPDTKALDSSLLIEHFQLSGMDVSGWTAHMSSLVANYKPLLTVIDTANMCLGIQDENDNGEATQILRNLRRCMRHGRPDGSLQILKHAKERDVRGAKSWKGVADAVYYQAKTLGPHRKDGWHNTSIEDLKVRAFGLKGKHKITPVLIGDGITLKIEPVQPKQKKRS